MVKVIDVFGEDYEKAGLWVERRILTKERPMSDDNGPVVDNDGKRVMVKYAYVFQLPLPTYNEVLASELQALFCVQPHSSLEDIWNDFIVKAITGLSYNRDITVKKILGGGKAWNEYNHEEDFDEGLFEQATNVMRNIPLGLPALTKAEQAEKAKEQQGFIDGAVTMIKAKLITLAKVKALPEVTKDMIKEIETRVKGA